jgi:hypothetical protein
MSPVADSDLGDAGLGDGTGDPFAERTLHRMTVRARRFVKGAGVNAMRLNSREDSGRACNTCVPDRIHRPESVEGIELVAVLHACVGVPCKAFGVTLWCWREVSGDDTIGTSKRDVQASPGAGHLIWSF